MTHTSHLPAWDRLLVVVAHPDDESFGLGAVINAFAEQGARVNVLCFTQGEASTLGAAPDLAEIRVAELHRAAQELGAVSTMLDLSDGGLSDHDPSDLRTRVESAARSTGADGILVFDITGITGHPDHIAASRAAVEAATVLDLPVLAWTLPDDVAETLVSETGAPFNGCGARGDLVLEVDRTVQRAAINHHISQAVPGSVLWRRLELQGNEEHLIWLRR